MQLWYAFYLVLPCGSWLMFFLFQAGGPTYLYAEYTDVRGTAMFINYLRVTNRQVLSRFGTLPQQWWTAGHRIPQEVSQLRLTCVSLLLLWTYDCFVGPTENAFRDPRKLVYWCHSHSCIHRMPSMHCSFDFQVVYLCWYFWLCD